jgi:hypothetical protein
MISLLKVLDRNNMWIKDLFSKRKPNNLVIYLDYDGRDAYLFKIFSKLTYSIGPVKTIGDAISGLNKFKEKYPFKLKYITINTYGRGKHLVNTKELKNKEGEEKLNVLLDELVNLLDENGAIQFATCFGGLSHRKLVEFSEKYDGVNVGSMYGQYSLKGKAVVCKCTQKGYSESVVQSLPKSKNGMLEDEFEIVNIYTRDEGEEVNWKTCGMAYEYNKLMVENGICSIQKQPFTSLECVINYLFNKQ